MDTDQDKESVLISQFVCFGQDGVNGFITDDQAKLDGTFTQGHILHPLAKETVILLELGDVRGRDIWHLHRPQHATAPYRINLSKGDVDRQ